MIRSRTLILAAYVATALAYPRLVVASNSCQNTFSGFTQIALDDLKFNAGIKPPSVRSEQLVRDEEGFNLRVITKTAESWNSHFRVGKNDIQGDPRAFAMILGPAIGHQFGFQHYSKNSITVPTPSTLQHYIEIANKKLKAARQPVLPINFYETGSAPLSGLEYLKRFVKNSELPISQNGHVMIHDISYHAPSIVMLPKMVDVLRLRIKFLLDLHSHLKNSTKLSVQEKELALSAFERSLERAIDCLDYTSGNLSFVLVIEGAAPLQTTPADFQKYSFRYAHEILPAMLDSSYVKSNMMGELLLDDIEKATTQQKVMLKGIDAEIDRFYALEEHSKIVELDYNPAPKDLLREIHDRIDTLKRVLAN